MVKVLKEMDALPPQATKVAHVTAEVVRSVEGDGVANKKSVIETQKEITTYWKRYVERKKMGVCYCSSVFF
ncbi:hypothetical protein AAC387_Pa02g5130 [Persea americana]